MGLLSGMSTGLYRFTHDGRRVFGFAVGGRWFKRWYFVPDEAAPRLERRLRQLFVLTSFLLIPVAVVFAPGVWWLWLSIPLVVTPLLLFFWVYRGLERVSITEEDLVPTDKRARELAQLHAMGEPLLWLLVAAGVAMAALPALLLTQEFDWIAVAGVMMFSTLTLMMLRGVLMLRKKRRSEP